MKGMARGLLVWLLIMLAESVHGVLRGLLLVPRIGEEAAARLGWPVGAIIVLAIAYLAIGRTRVRERGRLMFMGGLWAVLTVGFEIAIGLLRGMGQQEILAALDPRTGTIAYSALLMLFAPLIAARLRRIML
jgi:hypothetical protein